MAERRYQNYICIFWINNHRADLARIFQPDVLPRFPGIDRFEHAGAVRGITANGCFACAGVNYVMIRRRDRDRAN